MTKTNTNTKHTKGTKNVFYVPKLIGFVLFVSFVLAVFVPLMAQAPPRRIISLVPNVTEILFAIGAGPQVVAVSTYDVEPPEVRTLPTVGALLDPDTERIISLRPDLVITYGTQNELQAQLKSANIPYFDYRHAGLEHVMVTMRELGQRTGHAKALLPRSHRGWVRSQARFRASLVSSDAIWV